MSVTTPVETVLAPLFVPITLGAVEIRNRVVMTGHGTGMAKDYLPTDQHVAYYRERAIGGVGLIGMAFPQIHPTSQDVPGEPRAWLPEIVPVTELYFALKHRDVPVERIGDAIASRTMMEAVHEGERAAWRVCATA
ncbi:hypothetical protein [Mycobacterium sp. NPDC006124]|uniref:oxidoreductase n=1 Tax=Mycobacterium sp. NPDC006124 TaxID=3156729 RepID=UPI0033B62AA7